MLNIFNFCSDRYKREGKDTRLPSSINLLDVSLDSSVECFALYVVISSIKIAANVRLGGFGCSKFNANVMNEQNRQSSACVMRSLVVLEDFPKRDIARKDMRA